jgi:Plasmid pRiA4b ORF-3-like protein
MRSDSTVTEFHQTIQIAFAWSGRRSYQLTVQGQRQPIQPNRDIWHVSLSDFNFYPKERFAYIYNTGDAQSRPWQFEIRLEQKLGMEAPQLYPRCIGGVGASPPEACGGPIAFESLRELFTPEYFVWRLAEMRAEGWTEEHDAELRQLQPWMHRKLDRHAINQRLRQVGKHTTDERPQP